VVSGAPAPLTAQGLGNANTPSTDPLLKPSPPTSTGGHGSGRTVGAAFAGDADQLDEGQRVEVPTAFADVADPLIPTPPRSLVEKAMRVVRWTAPRTGGHFAPVAAPPPPPTPPTSSGSRTRSRPGRTAREHGSCRVDRAGVGNGGRLRPLGCRPSSRTWFSQPHASWAAALAMAVAAPHCGCGSCASEP
jgi:hypothetical protein